MVVQCHILCAVMDMLSMASLNDVPDIGISREKFKNKCKAEKEFILRIAQQVVSRLVDLSVGFTSQSDKTSKDHVFEYYGKLYPWDFCF